VLDLGSQTKQHIIGIFLREERYSVSFDFPSTARATALPRCTSTGRRLSRRPSGVIASSAALRAPTSTSELIARVTLTGLGGSSAEARASEIVGPRSTLSILIRRALRGVPLIYANLLKTYRTHRSCRDKRSISGRGCGAICGKAIPSAGTLP
jgi:hypothetical protein